MAEPEVTPTARQSPVPGLDPRDATASRIDLAIAVGMGLLAFLAYILPSAWRPIDETAEARVAVVAREMLRSGDWVVPRLGEQPRYTKPPLPYWLTAYAGQTLGPDALGRPVTEQAAVLPSAMLAALGVFMLVAFAARVHGRAAGVWAGLLLGLAPLYAFWAHHGTGEMPLTVFTAAALLAAGWLTCAPRPGFFSALLLGLALGLAVLCKGHIPLLIVLGAVALESVRAKSFGGRKAVLLLLALVVCGGVVAPWFVMLNARAPEALGVIWGEIVSPAESTGHRQSDWPFFFIKMLPVWLMPWTLLLFAAFPVSRLRVCEERARAGRGLNLAERLERFMLGAAILGFLGFEVIPKQQDYYLLPILPPLALAGAAAIARLNRPGGFAEEGIAWAQLALAVLVPGLLAASPALVPLFGGEPAETPPWELAVPLAMVTFMLLIVASRLWVDGRPAWAGACVGATVFSLLLSIFVMRSIRAQDDNLLAREAPALRAQLHVMGSNLRVYTVKVGGSQPRHLYYLDTGRVFGINELVAETVDGKTGQPIPPKPGDPVRVVICPRAIAEKLGAPVSDGALQVIQLGYGVTGAHFKSLK